MSIISNNSPPGLPFVVYPRRSLQRYADVWAKFVNAEAIIYNLQKSTT